MPRDDVKQVRSRRGASGTGRGNAWRDTASSLIIRLCLAWVGLFAGAVMVYYRGHGDDFEHAVLVMKRSDYPPVVAFVVVTVVMVGWSCLRARTMSGPRLRWALPGLTAPLILFLIGGLHRYSMIVCMGDVCPDPLSPEQIYAVRLHQAVVPHFGSLSDSDETFAELPGFLLVPWASAFWPSWGRLPWALAIPGALFWLPTLVAVWRSKEGRFGLIGVHGYGLLFATALLYVGSALYDTSVDHTDLQGLASAWEFFPRAGAAALIRATIILVVTTTAVETGRLYGRDDGNPAQAF